MTAAWVIPTAITAVSLVAAAAYTDHDLRSGGYTAGLLGCFAFPFAIIVSLVAWLIWALAA